MISENLFDEILLQPVRDGATELRVVSGYASAPMASLHLGDDLIKDRNVKVVLIYGMVRNDGVLLTDHRAFMDIEESKPFECHYRIAYPAVHSKVYVWMAEGKPVKAFVGSANYTQPGFSMARNRCEAMSEGDPQQALDYFEFIKQGAMEIGHDDIDQHVRFHKEGQQLPEDSDCETVPLYERSTGEVQRSAGLNWAFRQRPGYNRNLDQAYIQIGARLGRSDFFPPKPTRFTVICDDDVSFLAVRAQKSPGGDAIETPEGNNILGEYIRRRLGVQSGTYITRAMLDKHGLAHVRFCKIDDHTFSMDFVA